jgi:hypothetical protein
MNMDTYNEIDGYDVDPSEHIYAIDDINVDGFREDLLKAYIDAFPFTKRECEQYIHQWIENNMEDVQVNNQREE